MTTRHINANKNLNSPVCSANFAMKLRGVDLMIDSELETTGELHINMSLPHKNEEYGTEVYW